MAVGSRINASDYNAIRLKVLRVLGEGGISPITGLPDPTFGYGQSLESVPVVVSDSVLPSQLNIVKRSQWLALRNDIVRVKLHQDGAVPPIADVPVDAVVRFGTSHPNNNFDFIITQSAQLSSRFKLDTNTQAEREIKETVSTSDAWASLAETTVTVTFSSAANARYFFNSGAKIIFSSSRSGGSATAQNNSWTSLLTSVGFRSFEGYTISGKNFYNLTNNFETLYELSASSVYANNKFIISVRSNVANNSGGTATILEFRIQWRDLYTDSQPSPPPDQVDGTLTLTVEEIRSSTFTLEGPSGYSVLPISVS